MRRRLSLTASLLAGTALSVSWVAVAIASGPGGPFPK